MTGYWEWCVCERSSSFQHAYSVEPESKCCNFCQRRADGTEATTTNESLVGTPGTLGTPAGVSYCFTVRRLWNLHACESRYAQIYTGHSVLALISPSAKTTRKMESPTNDRSFVVLSCNMKYLCPVPSYPSFNSPPSCGVLCLMAGINQRPR